MLDLVEGADLVAYCGGTTLTEIYQLDGKIFDIDVARRAGRPYVFLQQSAGPFVKQSNRDSLGRQFRESALVVLRDERSKTHVEDLGVPQGRCIVLPDTAFALASPEHLHASKTDGSQDIRLAISVREWKHFGERDPEEGMRIYIEALRQTVSVLVREQGAHVTFVSTCQGRPEYWTDDSKMALKIYAGLEEDVRRGVTVDRAFRTTQELLEFLSTFDAMVSTRLHGAILAVDAGVPTLAIAYEYKTHEVWSQLGLQRYVLDIEDLDPSHLVEATVSLLQDRAKVRTILQREVPVMAEGALSAASAIRSVLNH